MIAYATGDILEADAEALVNTVNCVGFMGRGIAAQFKRAFPANFRAYESACKRGEVRPGAMFVFETGQLTNPRFIINFPTKRHWRGQSRLEDIVAGLEALAHEVEGRGVTSIAVPPLGCGLGGLEWHVVRPLIERAFAELPQVRVVIFEPAGAPIAKPLPQRESPKMTPGRAVLVGLIDRYLAGLLDPFVSLLELHKLLYFAQEAGEALRLRYVKAPYGPYAENLRHVLSAIEGHFVSGYADGGDAPAKQLQLVPGAVEEARACLERHPETLRRFDRVVDLVQGFETSFGMELLATVHWTISRGEVVQDDIVNAVHRWGERKLAFSPRQIRLAAEQLHQGGWIPA